MREQVDNHIGFKKQLIYVSVDSYNPNYQTKVFFNNGNIHNLRNKLITSMQLVTSNELDQVDNLSVIDLTSTDFSTYLTLVGRDGKVILNLLPAPLLYNYDFAEATSKVLRQFIMKVDWDKSYLLLVWNASPVAGSVMAFNIGYVDNVNQLPDPVKKDLTPQLINELV